MIPQQQSLCWKCRQLSLAAAVATNRRRRGTRCGFVEFNCLSQARQSSSSAAGMSSRATNSLPALPTAANAIAIWRARNVKRVVGGGERGRWASTYAGGLVAEGYGVLEEEGRDWPIFQGKTRCRPVSQAEGPPTRTKSSPILRLSRHDPVQFEKVRAYIEKLTRYRFRDADYLKAALYNDGVSIAGDEMDRTQKHLAVIGDSIYKVIYYADHFPLQSNAPRLRFDAVSSNVHFSKMAHRLDLVRILNTFTIPSRSSTSRPSIHMEATIVEAIVGAIYLDSGSSEDATREVIYAMGLGELTTFGSSCRRIEIRYSGPNGQIRRETAPTSSPDASSADVTAPSPATPAHGTTSQEESSSGEVEKTNEAATTEAVSSTAKTRARIRNRKRQDRKKSILRKFVPGANRTTTLTDLVKSLSWQLETSDIDAQLRKGLPVIEQTLQGYKPGDPAHGDVQQLLERTAVLQETASSPEDREDIGEDVGEADGEEESRSTDSAPSPNKAISKPGSPHTRTIARGGRRRRQLQRCIPGADTSMTFTQLLDVLQAKLRADPGDPALRLHKADIQDVLHEYGPSNTHYGLIVELQRRMDGVPGVGNEDGEGQMGRVGEERNLYAQFHV